MKSNRRPGRYARREWKRMRNKRGQWLQKQIEERDRAALNDRTGEAKT